MKTGDRKKIFSIASGGRRLIFLPLFFLLPFVSMSDEANINISLHSLSTGRMPRPLVMRSGLIA